MRLHSQTPVMFGTTLITKSNHPHDSYRINFVEDGLNDIYYKEPGESKAIKGFTGTQHNWLKEINLTDPDPSGLVLNERREEHIIKYLYALKQVISGFNFYNPANGLKEVQFDVKEFSKLLAEKAEQIRKTSSGYRFSQEKTARLDFSI